MRIFSGVSRFGKLISRKSRRIYESVFAAKSSIKYRLMFFFVLLSLTPLLILGAVAYSTSKSTIDNTVLDYSRQLTIQTAENIDIKLEYYKDNMMQILSNNEIISCLMDVLKEAKSNPPSDGKISNTVLTTKLASYISTLQESKSISFISDRYYIKGTYFCTDEILNGNSTFYKKIMEGGNNFSWFSTRPGSYGYVSDSHRVDVFSLGKQVYNINNMGRINLGAVIDIREEVLSDICSKASRANLPAQCFLVDGTGMIMAHPDQNMLFKNVSDLFSSEDVFRLLDAGTKVSSFETKFFDKSVIANVVKLKVNDWRVINIIENEYLYKDSNRVVKTIFLMALICIILSFIAAYLVSWGISRPLKNIVGIMRQVVASNLDARIDGTGNKSTSDEIAVLQESFNYMLSQIKELINKVYEEQNSKRISEIKALEAQINPHFLYNTLDTIKWTALFQKANNAAEMASLLSRLLHISLGKGMETVKVKEEIEHVQCYMGIQKFRFNFNIEVNYNIDEDTKELRIPKLILQPIVENSILHGLAEKQEGGIITINCFKSEEYLKFEIIDNGCGIDTNESDIFKQSKRKSGEAFSGIGIANVDERIKLICGNDYGIRIESQVNEGTKVEIKLPVMI